MAFPAAYPAPVTSPVLFANVLFLVLGDIAHMCHDTVSSRNHSAWILLASLKPTSCLNPSHDAKHKSNLVQHFTFLRSSPGAPPLCADACMCLGQTLRVTECEAVRGTCPTHAPRFPPGANLSASRASSCLPGGPSARGSAWGASTEP